MFCDCDGWDKVGLICIGVVGGWVVVVVVGIVVVVVGVGWFRFILKVLCRVVFGVSCLYIGLMFIIM